MSEIRYQMTLEHSVLPVSFLKCLVGHGISFTAGDKNTSIKIWLLLKNKKLLQRSLIFQIIISSHNFIASNFKHEKETNFPISFICEEKVVLWGIRDYITHKIIPTHMQRVFNLERVTFIHLRPSDCFYLRCATRSQLPFFIFYSSFYPFRS